MFTPNEEILQARKKISRRRALGLGGTVSLAGLLAACGTSNQPTSGSSSTGASTGSATGSASAATTAANSAAAGDVEQQLRELLAKAPNCVTSPEETQGPYYFDVDSIRRDITEDRPGLPLELMIRVHDTEGCVPGDISTGVENAAVEIWHCDAGGVYSGFEVASQSANQGGAGSGQPGAGGGQPPAGQPPAGGSPAGEPPAGQPPAGGPGGQPGGQNGDNGGPGAAASGSVSDGSYSAGEQEATTTDDGTYLRGAQMTDSSGIVRFRSIYPGWYVSRTVHIHVKVHINRDTVLTTQLFFDDNLSDKINAEIAPYNEHTGRDTYNKTDQIYSDEGLMQANFDGERVLAAINIGI